MSRLGDVLYRNVVSAGSDVNPVLRQLANRAIELKADSYADEFGRLTWYTAECLDVLRDMQSLARSGVVVRLYAHQLTVLVWAVVACQRDCPVSELGSVLAELEGYGIDGFGLLDWLGVSECLGLEVAA